MKILLLNECSNLHTTLAKGLKALGHDVTTVSGGNGWRNYPRDISLVRHNPSHLDGLRYLARLYSLLPRFRGYDVVQVNNPVFFDVKAERHFFIYDYLRRHNGSMFLGAFGTDYYWVSTCMEQKPLRYSDHNLGDALRDYGEAVKDRREWLGTPRERLNKYIAADCDGIIPCLFEYWAVYSSLFPEKTRFIPLPVEVPAAPATQAGDSLTDGTPATGDSHADGAPRDGRVSIFIGIDRDRDEYKGTDIMYRAALDVERSYPERCRVVKAENVPFARYQRLMDHSDILLDQLYSYTPAMNALLAMSKGLVVVGGGEPENYDILGERELRPIVNVLPTYESVRHELEQLVLHPERLPELKRQSVAYVRRHHDHLKVARQYEQFYLERLRR